MELVVNEWFPEYCKVEAAKVEKELLKTFLERFLQKEDILYIKRPSAFLNKIYSYSKEYQNHRDIYTTKLLTFFIRNVINNSARCVLVDEECTLEEVVLEKLNEGNYSSDAYLFEAASGTDNKLIITTDGRLCRQMHGIGGYTVISLTDFIKRY